MRAGSQCIVAPHPTTRPLPAYRPYMENAIRDRARELRATLRAQLAGLAADVDATRRNAAFREALATMAAFWPYSPFNQFLILLQRRDASRVAGRRTWERLGRRVKPGEAPLVVLAPTRRAFGFVEVPVFDVRQTRGRRLAALRTELRGRSRHVATLIRAAARLAVAVERRPLECGVGGRSRGDASRWTRGSRPPSRSASSPTSSRTRCFTRRSAPSPPRGSGRPPRGATPSGRPRRTRPRSSC
jgi:hypothetical protein